MAWASAAPLPPRTPARTQAQPDHREFDATLDVPYRAGPGAHRTIAVYLNYPDQGRRHRAAWQLELRSRTGAVLRRWHGAAQLGAQPLTVRLDWDGRAGGTHRVPAPGAYRLRLRARSGASIITQQWPIALGTTPLEALPPLRPLATGAARPATSGPPAPDEADIRPYTVYYGNLHSQTNHSDGGGDLAHCTGAQDPQSAALGPPDAYAYAQAHGLDFLMTSEHNHMYDGSDGTNPDADPQQATALYQRGLQDATTYNASHPGFLAIYGQEWGVIASGGHLNIFNSPELLGWERNASGQLLADTATAKNDYASLYSLMRARGWLGQFNHPAPDQFKVNGVPLAYTPDGDEVMALCEVMNSSAFSHSADESESHRSNYEAVCDQLLEAGYHVAFSSDQDNHCANWGASYSNRSAILLPSGTALDNASLLAALRARRVFATMDKQAQIVLTANGHLMGERFVNCGPLALSVRYAGAPGRAVAELTIIEGVPGRNGAVSELAHTADTSLTPAPGQHFYYARLTQDDGKLLWSAPVWVSQQPASLSCAVPP
ncbi:CehA/McbA family metallohydrolase [Duganella sp. FT3S]|uniref:CehA/McbA family metallohydrolase n=1 Tax=Rugamonas fusca TaxID=2758568 RepID=A0A7W2EEG4_9BURK|nr:CehA/McbA family metallohydrolase [Rugamonas fusca]MBA5604453.1 CehA/McbA family metallohydrolase [Rugamonas fusca]